MPDTGVGFAPGGYLKRVFDNDLANGAGSQAGKDFWIDRMLARTGTGGGRGDNNDWLFTRGRAAYIYTDRPDEPGFVGDAAYWHKTGHDAIYRIRAAIGTEALKLVEDSTRRRQTPSYFSTVFEDKQHGVRLRETKFFTEQNVAVTYLALSSTDGTAKKIALLASSPMASHAHGGELTGAFDARNRITWVFPRFSGDGFLPVDGKLRRDIHLPAGGTLETKLQLGLTTRELPESLAEYRRIAAMNPARAFHDHVVAYNRWWADNIPYLDTPEDNIDKILFYRWWLLRFNFLDADVPGNDYQFPVAIEGVLGYDNAIALTTGMFIDDLKYVGDPVYSYGSWVAAGETARRGKFTDNPGSPDNWSSSYAQYISAAAWRSYELHGGPPAIAGKLARYAEYDVYDLLRSYDRNGNHLIEYDWAAMTGNDGDAVSFPWAVKHGHAGMDRPESAYVYANARAAAAAYRAAGDTTGAGRMDALAATIRQSVLKVLWEDRRTSPDSMGLYGDLIKSRQAGGPRLAVDWKEINNYYPFMVGLMPKPGDADYDSKYIRALRLFADRREFPIFPFYTADQRDVAARGENNGSNNFSVINATVMFRLLASVLRDYPSPYIDAQFYKKLLYWNAWAHYIDGDNRYPDQNEFWAQGSAADGGSIGYRSWIHHTQLGGTNFTMIEDVMGLRPRGDGKIELYPIDIGWAYFAADHIRYRDHDLAITWDRDGSRYKGTVPRGYSVFLDGKLAFTVDALAHVVYDPARGTVAAADDTANGARVAPALSAPAVVGHVLTVNKMAVRAPEQVSFDPGQRIVAMMQKAGVEASSLAARKPDLALDAKVQASYAAPGFAPAGAVDGNTGNEPFWGTAGSPHASDWLDVDLGAARSIDDIRLYFYRSSSPDGQQHDAPSGTRAGYAAPRLYMLQYRDGAQWRTIPGQLRDPPAAQANDNHVRFPAIHARYLRLLVVHADDDRTGLKEIQVFHSGAQIAARDNQTPIVDAWIDDGSPLRGSSLHLVGDVGDDALPNGQLDVHWEIVQAPPGASVLIQHPAQASTDVRFTAAGHYRLRLVAADGQKTSSKALDIDLAAPSMRQRNIAGSATASAQFTAGQNRLSALNDGIQGSADDPQDRLWGSWGKPLESVWIQYAWKSPVRIAGAALQFWTDHPAGAREGVAPPTAWKLQYDDGTRRWKDVAHPGAYTLHADAPNAVTFDPVNTTGLRAVLSTAGEGSHRAAVGVSEWQVFVDPPDAIAPMDIRTAIGTPPRLPGTVTVSYRDGSSRQAEVDWPPIDASKLKLDGRIDLVGMTTDADTPVPAIVWIRGTEPGQINTVDALPDIHLKGAQKPVLPVWATVQYNDGSRERVAIQWSAIEPSCCEKGKRYRVSGVVRGRARTGETSVHVDVVVERDTPH